MAEPVRILHIVGAMYPGGVENFIMNLYRHIDRERFQFDFIVHQRREKDYVPEIELLGGRVYELPRLTRHPASNLRQIAALTRENGYAAVIRHTANALIAPQLMAAKRGGALTVCHSHSSDDPQLTLHRLGRRLLPAAADLRFACSEQAGRWMYGEAYRGEALPIVRSRSDVGADAAAGREDGESGRRIRRAQTGEIFPEQADSIPDASCPCGISLRQKPGTFQVIRNAVDLKAFAWSAEKAARIREEFHITGRHIYGNVANYIEVKNHPFQMRIYREIVNREPDAVCLCVGEGELRPQIEAQIRELGLERNVILTGLRSDVADVLSAMDVLVFPSHFEGLPLTLIEAQAAGLPMLISDAITKDVAVTEGLVEWRPITEDPADWAQRAVQLAESKVDLNGQPLDRRCQRERIAAAGYDLEELVGWYERFFEACAAGAAG